MRHIHERMVNDMGWWPNMNRVIAYSILRNEDTYVLRLSKSARWENGVKVEGRSCSRLGGISLDGGTTW